MNSDSIIFLNSLIAGEYDSDLSYSILIFINSIGVKEIDQILKAVYNNKSLHCEQILYTLLQYTSFYKTELSNREQLLSIYRDLISKYSDEEALELIKCVE